MAKAQHKTAPLLSRAKGAPGKGRAAKPAAKKARRSSKGATRKVAAVATPRRMASAWLNRLLVLAGVGVVLTAAVQAYMALERIPVQRISVTGELEHTRSEVVQEMVQPALSGGFLNADLQLIRQELQALPWIYEVNVRRKWPNALEIHVIEQLPIARWGKAGFLNHEGEVFYSHSAEQWQSLPLLLGPEGEAAALVATYQRLMEFLGPLGLALQQLSVDERAQVEAVLVGGAQLSLGGDEFLERMQRFVMIYHSELAPRMDQVQRVDLRYASGIAVAFSEPAQVAGL